MLQVHTHLVKKAKQIEMSTSDQSFDGNFPTFPWFYAGVREIEPWVRQSQDVWVE